MTQVQECLAENIKAFRKERKITQERLAEIVGTSTNYIGTIETCKKFPSPKMIERIALALKVDSLVLFQPIIPAKQKERAILKQELLQKISVVLDETII